MNIRFEVARSQSFYWKYFVQRAKRHGKYKITGKGAAELHVVTCETMDAAVEVWQVVRSWKCVSYIVDGKMIGQSRMNDAMRKHQFRDVRAKEMLQTILNKKAAERNRGDDEGRWRMGLGPDPDLGF